MNDKINDIDLPFSDAFSPCPNISHTIQAMKSIQNDQINPICNVIFANYDLDFSSGELINFLSDYIKFLSEKNIIDPKIEGWKKEKNKTSLSQKKKDEVSKINLDSGNYDEKDILKSLTHRKRGRREETNLEGEVKQRREKNPTGTAKKKNSDYAPFEVINTNIRDFSNLDETESKNRFIPLSGLRKADSPEFDEDAFDMIMREFLKINDFPKEAKDKLSLLKKFIPIYKRVKNDRNKLHNFSQKISENLFEPIEEIIVNKT